jgi:hypothetical protein
MINRGSRNERINSSLEERCNVVYQKAREETFNLLVEINLLKNKFHEHTGLLPDTILAQVQALASGVAGPQYSVKKDELYPDSILLSRTRTDGSKKFDIRVDLRNDIVTVVYHGDSAMADKKNGLVGTDNTAVIKMLGKNSYDHLKIDDLLDKQISLFKAAMDLMPKESEGRQRLEGYQKLMIARIKNECDFYNPEHLARTGEGNFKDKHKNFRNMLSESVKEICKIIKESNQDKRGWKEIARDLRHREVAMLNQNGRPLVIKTKEIAGKEFFSLQMPLGVKTIVSTDRSGSDPNVKLSNHVRDASGIINQNGQIKIKYSVDGHSSYPPIDIKNEEARRIIAREAGREKVRQLILDQFSGDSAGLQLRAKPPREAISINFTTMMMLTPTKAEILEMTSRGTESENKQFNDTMHVIDYLRQTPDIDLPGIGRVNVSIDINVMNLPVNITGVKQKLAEAPAQKEVNLQGMHTFAKQVKDFTNLSENEINQRSLSGLTQYSGITNIASIFAVIKQAADAKDRATADTMLRGMFKQPSVSNAINAIEQLLDDDKNHAKLTIRTRESLIDRLYILKTMDTFYNEKSSEKDFTYQFHVNFLKASERMGICIEAFCKSAEDRTGWLRISMSADDVFTETYGRPPNIANAEDKEKYHTILQTCFELSASLENTKYNSEARGLQSGEKTIMPNLGQDNAATAKGCFPKSGVIAAAKKQAHAVTGMLHSKSSGNISKSKAPSTLAPEASKPRSAPVSPGRSSNHSLHDSYISKQQSDPGLKDIVWVAQFIEKIKISDAPATLKLLLLRNMHNSLKDSPYTAVKELVQNTEKSYAMEINANSVSQVASAKTSPDTSPPISPTRARRGAMTRTERSSSAAILAEILDAPASVTESRVNNAPAPTSNPSPITPTEQIVEPSGKVKPSVERASVRPHK